MKLPIKIIIFIFLITTGLWAQTGTDSLIPLTEMGSGFYKTFPGGLYPAGSNELPALHAEAGLAISSSIVHLDTNGNIDFNKGKIVLLSIGMSNTTQEFSVFKSIADTLKNKNPYLTIVDGAQGGQTASIIQDPKVNFWTVVNQRLTASKVSPKQVQIIWLKEADIAPKDNFPVHAQTLSKELKVICQQLKTKFPNSKICFLSSRIYGGYATSTLNPEPMAYESGFSVKWLIESQIQGDTALIFSGSNPKSPWLAWGPYLWANGTKPREDGLIWEKGDFVTTDYTHPSDKGRLKVANMLLKFFSNNENTIPWFMKNAVDVFDESKDNFQISIFPNPAKDYLILPVDLVQTGDLSIFTTIGINILHKSLDGNILDISILPGGVYFLKAGDKVFKFVKY